MRNNPELSPLQEAQLGSICASHVEIAFSAIEHHKTNVEASKKELLDIRQESKRSGYQADDIDYIIQNHDKYIQSLEKEVADSEMYYEAAYDQAVRYAGLNTLGAFVLTVLSEKKRNKPGFCHGKFLFPQAARVRLNREELLMPRIYYGPQSA